jgi:Tol biopolymer transport system component
MRRALAGGRGRSAVAAAFALALVLGGQADAATRYQPRLRFRVLKTAHFRIYYHQGEDRLAARLAAIAESVRAALPDRMRLRAPALTHVVLADQDDEPNGSATPLPYNTITMTAGRPPLSDMTGNTNDWLRLVFTHEYVHILQLDQSFGWAAAFRTVLGRSPIVFPNLFLPRWQIEGLATYEESATTGQGRLYSGDSAAIVRGRALVAGPEPLDRVNGGLTDWPGELAPYLDGAFFYDFLVARFGEARVGEVSRSAAGRLPYLAAPAFKKAFGRSLGSLWTDFQKELEKPGAPAVVESPAARQLTRRGYHVTGPRFADEGRSVVFSVEDADRFPSLMVLPLEGEGEPRRLADRFRGTHAGVYADRVYFDQVELVDNVAWRSDLFVADLGNGRAARLTRGARLVEPDVSPDGRTLACLRAEGDRRVLALFRLDGGGGTTLAERPLTGPRSDAASYGSPRWSPDGRSLAAERRLSGGRSEIVVIDLETGAETVIASSVSARNITPAWLPDGSTVVFASDRAGRAFQLYAVSARDTGALRQITSEPGGAMYPDVSPDGRRIVYVGSGASGYDLFELSLDVRAWRPVESAEHPAAAAAAPLPDPAPSVAATDGSYSPLPTVLPRSWTPLVDTSDNSLRVGFAVDGVDVLGRHSFATTVRWRVTGSSESIDGSHPARPDWSAQYAYTRWRPSLVLAASDETSFVPASSALGEPGPDVELREQEATAGVSLALRRVRHTQLWYGAFVLERDTVQAPREVTVHRRNGIQAAWAFNSARVYGRSISPEDGFAAALTAEPVRASLGAAGDADAYTAEIRNYLRIGRGHAVLATRAGFGMATGDLSVRRRFYLGGSSGAGQLVDFGSDELSMLRGFDDKVFSGFRIAVINVEWRQPLWRVERGWGTVPVFVRTVHAAAFADLGNVWNSRFSAADTKSALGAEGSVDLVLGFNLPLTVSAGVGWTHDGAPPGRSGAAAYIRIGRAF